MRWRHLTGLEPAIRLLKGDKTDVTETSSDVVETFSSSPDTTGVMRPVEGGQIYILRVSTSIDGDPVKADDVLTIRILPFGNESPGIGMYVLLKIRKQQQADAPDQIVHMITQSRTIDGPALRYLRQARSWAGTL